MPRFRALALTVYLPEYAYPNDEAEIERLGLFRPIQNHIIWPGA